MSDTQSQQEAFDRGCSVARASIKEIVPIANEFGANEAVFWYAVFSGFYGAACAKIGFPAMREMFTELQRAFDAAELEIEARAINAKRKTTH